MIHGTMHLERGDCDSKEFAFQVPAIIGRSKLADVTILHPLISRKHCELTETNDGRLAIRDLDSLNGTFVGETRVKQSVLQPGDVLTLGPFTYRIEYSPETAENEATEGLRANPDHIAQSREVDLVPFDDPTAGGKAGQGTTIESAGSPLPPQGGADKDDAKTTTSGSIEPPDIGAPPPKSISGDDPALQDFLKRLP